MVSDILVSFWSPILDTGEVCQVAVMSSQGQ
jgi:hypothetical protein